MISNHQEVKLHQNMAVLELPVHFQDVHVSKKGCASSKKQTFKQMKVSFNASPEHRDIQRCSDPVKVAQSGPWAQNW